MALPKTPLARLELAGTLMYGARWKTACAPGLGVTRESVHNWLSTGRPPVDLDRRIDNALRRWLERAEAVAKLSKEFEKKVIKDEY
jgi:hypothetical protein